jgi:S-adenosylmethionine:tRNA ribosyltransferase-isomerase
LDRPLTRDDLDYELPPELIAQEPVRPRDASRLLVVDRARDDFEELRFAELESRLSPNDLLVVNDTRVRPAKLRGRKASGGRAEALLLGREDGGGWRAFVRARGRLKPGLELRFGELEATVERVGDEGECVLCFAGLAGRDEDAVLARIGEAPLPPYIARPEPRKQDLDDYQTVFARDAGAVAAPTASLHFTPELAARLRIATVTLHVGPGTFRPLRSERVEDHRLDPERFSVPDATARAIGDARAAGGRVIAVGTTTVRALETTGGAAGSGAADLLITPGHVFRAVDALITNLHLPCSSLLALVMAFAGVERTRAAYRHAVAEGYRFYSYGDAMWIV